MADDLSDILFNSCDIQRAVSTQGGIGGTKYDWTTPTALVTDITCSIQSLPPMDVEDFARRGISVSHKVYTQANVSAVQLGDRVVNPDFIPSRYFEIKFVQDMGRREMYAIFCNLIK